MYHSHLIAQLGHGGIGVGSGGFITNPVLSPQLQGLVSATNPQGFFALLIPNLISLVLMLGTIIFFWWLLQGAIKWIISEGDKANLQGARDQITHAIIGLFILFSVFAIARLLEYFFGIKILTLDLSPLFIH